MPNNNNLIPKENHKKVEEVREIKNQIPSFEEFLNNYSQEQVNYDDLTHNDISSSKGYGPCHYSNADCTCYASQGFMQLYIPCPAVGCSSNRSAYTWLHSKNGYLMTFTGQNDDCGVLLISSQGHKKPTADTFINALSMTGGSIRNRSA
ncbi:950_t:CDS:2, partial [Ambispora leptoticha]